MTAESLPVLLIPAYQPSTALPELVAEVLASGVFAGAVIVDDGSDQGHVPVFRQVQEIPAAVVLPHAVNLGKGAALKTGLNHVACYFPKSVGAVTADADGQHLASDIVAVGRALAESGSSLVLGARRFDTTEVPLRSRLGNTVSRYVMRAVTGQNLTDTQTGLRGIPRDFIPDLLRSRPTGYDFELDMLVACKLTGRRIVEVPITTVYLEQNRSSHFDPLRDSMRVYFVLLRFAATSLITSGIDNLMFLAILQTTTNLLTCMVGARLVACVFNYYASKRGVFHSKAQNAVALPRFLASVLFAGTVSYGLIHGAVTYLHAPVVPAKITTESVMFVLSFLIQRDFVFAQRHAGASEG